MTEIMRFGEQVTNDDKFYIILTGSVNVLSRNPLIDQWNWAMSVYNTLLEWKEKEFDKRVSKSMNFNFKKYKKKLEH